MKNYEVGQTYEMNTRACFQFNSHGDRYIAVYDPEDESMEYRIFNIMKCQDEEVPATLYVKARSKDAFGHYKFDQDEARVKREHYEVGKMYSFTVTGIEEDNNSKPYYELEDDFANHRYYILGEQKYQIGDDCILEVEMVDDKGFLRFKEVSHHNPESATTPQTPYIAPEDNGEHYYVKYGPENKTVEYKTSIVFNPKTNAPDIDTQIWNIVKELSAFMNAEGGKLIIGVHDKTQEIIGIEQDYEHLNESEKDTIDYPLNDDGYKRKIINALKWECGSYASSLIEMDFKSKGGKKYCVIEVKKAESPIWMKDNKLFQRQDGTSQGLYGDGLTNFIVKRMSQSIQVRNAGVEFDYDKLVEAMKQIINERHAPIVAPKLRDLGEVDYWIVWYTDGLWKRVREKSAETNVAIQVPVYKSMSNPVLTFCYENGRVSTIKLETFRKGANLNKIQKGGWCDKNGQPKNIFLMLQTDYLVGYSVDAHSLEYVKLHSISDYTPTEKATNIGAPFIANGTSIISYAVLGSEHRKKVEHLIVNKAQRTQQNGEPLISSNTIIQEQINYLKKVLQNESK